MKFPVFALVLATTISSSAFAGEKCDRKCTSSGAAAAATMTAGYTALKGYIKVRDIEKRFLKDIFTPGLRLPGDYNVNKIRPGDKVLITYSESGHINSQYAKYQYLDENLEKLSKYINELQSGLKEAKNPKTFGFIAKEVDADEVRALTRELAKAEESYNSLLKEVSKVNQGLKVRHAAKTIVLRNTNDNQVAYKLRELVESGKSVYKIKKVPSSIMKKLARAKGAYILAGTAVAIGLITAEEVYSGKIAVAREEELKKFN